MQASRLFSRTFSSFRRCGPLELHMLRSASAACERHYSSPAVVTPPFFNEPLLTFASGSSEREKLQKALETFRGRVEDIPCVIGGREVFTGNVQTRECPYDKQRPIANYHWGNEELIKEAIQCSLRAREEWDNSPLEHRSAIFLRAADLLSTKYRYDILAATMIGQGKTAHQAEIDATCELIDFYRSAVDGMVEMSQTQPPLHSTSVWNRLEYRGLEGFIAAISPFNFTAIGGNLGATPTIVGNVTVWKPSDTAILSNWIVFKILREAGIPDGVINFVPTDGPVFGNAVTSSPDLAGVTFTGSSKTFKHLWKQVGANVDVYKTFPRVVGECGGKNFHLLHETADVESAVKGTVRSAFEFSGQKCSAVSRLYVPESLWPKVKEGLVSITKEHVTVGDPENFTTFTSSVIDATSYKKITSYLDYAKNDTECTILTGGNGDDSVGYFIEPTIIQTSNPKSKLLEEEIFGPVLTVYVYPNNKWEETLQLINTTSPYGLTGSIFIRDRYVLQTAMKALRNAAGNFYINDKSTGSVVGQQPFGGCRQSGTNDKTGMLNYLMRWASPLSIKEATAPITDIGYPSVDRK